MRRGDGRACIKRMRGVGRWLEEVVERARCRLGVMIDRRQVAIAVRAHAQGLPRRSAVSHRTKHLLATEHQFDRLSDHTGRHDAENLRSGDQSFAPEAAAEERTADVNLVRGDAEKSGEAALRHGQTLARRIDRERIAVPCGHDRMRLHRIVILGRGLVGRFDLLRGCGKTGLDVAPMYFCRISDADARRHEALGRIKLNPRRIGIVARRQQRGSFRRGLQRLRDDDGDRLVGVTDPVVLQQIKPKHEGICFCVRVLGERRFVGRRHHLNDARMGFGGRNIEKSDAAACDAAHRHHGVEHPGRMVVGGVPGGAGDFEDSLAAGEGLTDVRAVPNMSGRLRECDLRHG